MSNKTKKKAKAKAKVKAKNAKKPAIKAKPVKKNNAKVKPHSKKQKAKSNAKAKAKIKSAPQQTKPKEVIPMKEKKISPTNGNGITLKLRYSDKDLLEFKGIITEKLVEARRDLDLLRSSMSHLDDHGTDDTSPTFKLMEDGSDVLSKEETAQLASRQQKFIKHLEDAMVRIENKSYGICRITGNLIPKERLKVVPHATLSIEAKQKQF